MMEPDIRLLTSDVRWTDGEHNEVAINAAHRLSTSPTWMANILTFRFANLERWHYELDYESAYPHGLFNR